MNLDEILNPRKTKPEGAITIYTVTWGIMYEANPLGAVISSARTSQQAVLTRTSKFATKAKAEELKANIDAAFKVIECNKGYCLITEDWYE